jgi:putative membrane protein
MSYVTLDLVLAIAHHLLVFAIFGILAFELATIRQNMTAMEIRRVSAVDIWYGILAGAILAVGFSRAIYAAKGWAYYSTNVFFWAKIATFALVGVLSIQPTLAVVHWRRALARNPDALPTPGAIRNARQFLWAEVLLFGFVLAFAAAMARGYGAISP